MVVSMWRTFCCVIGRWCLLWPVHSLCKILLAFVLLHFVLQCQTCLLLQVSLHFLLLHSCLLWWKGHVFLILVLEGLVGLHRAVWLQLLQHYWLGHRLELLWYWLVCLETNGDDSVIFEIASTYCTLDSFIDYEGYSISSKGFLPTVLDIMVIWDKFTHSSLFWFTDSYINSMLVIKMMICAKTQYYPTVKIVYKNICRHGDMFKLV